MVALSSGVCLRRLITSQVAQFTVAHTLVSRRGVYNYASCRAFASTSDDGSCTIINETTTLLRNHRSGGEIILVGTAHVSKRSAEEVREVIARVKPEFVMVELDAARAARLRQGKLHDSAFLKEALAGFFKAHGSMGQQLLKVGMQGFYRLLSQLGMEPGGEFKAAMEAADALNARIVYGDQAMDVTLKRLADAVTLRDVMAMMTRPSPAWEAASGKGLGMGGLEGLVEGMKTRAAAQRVSAYFRAANPKLAAALIDERDDIMVRAIAGQQGRGVAVVGLAHLEGMEQRWREMQGSSRILR
jgi:pheromone shutdown protein TraB